MSTPVECERGNLTSHNPHPHAPMDHRYFPHLIDAILQHPESWLPLRATSKDFKKRIDALLFEKVVVRKAYMVENIESQLQAHMIRPTVVQNHYGPLPLFAPRQYLLQQSRQWASLKLRWAPLLKKYTKVLDVHIDVVHGGDAWALVACFPRVKTLRITVWYDAQMPSLSWGKPDFITNFDIDKLVLFPAPPLPLEVLGDDLSSNIIVPVTARKVVSIILCQEPLGPHWGPMWLDQSGAVKHVVFIFRPPSVDQLAAFEASDDSHNHVSLRWRYLAAQVSLILRDIRKGKNNNPKLTFVDFPRYKFAKRDTCDQWANLGISIKLNPKKFFERLVAHDMSALHDPPQDKKAYWRRFISKSFEYLSLKEYAKTLEPGELANETQINLS